VDSVSDFGCLTGYHADKKVSVSLCVFVPLRPFFPDRAADPGAGSPHRTARAVILQIRVLPPVRTHGSRTQAQASALRRRFGV
jgi:hypothetical protein